MIPNEKLRIFFTDYENRVNNALKDPAHLNLDDTADCFCSCFVGASPSGVRCGANDEYFRQAVSEGYSFYRRIGTGSMRILKIDFTEIDGYHVMARVTWDSRYMKKDKEIAVSFDVVYLLQILDDKPRIFAYITGDEQAVLREHGLLE